MKEMPIILENQHQRIKGSLHKPDNETGSLIILVHGFTGDRNGPDNIFIKLSQGLSEQGFTVLRFDFRGSGESEGDFIDMTIMSEVSDLKTVLNYAKKNGYSKVGLVGESLGGAVSILGCDERIKSLVLWYPVIFRKETFRDVDEKKQELEKTGSILIEGGGRTFRVGKSFVEERDTIDIASKIPNIKCPLLIITGDNDSDVHHNQSERAIELSNEPKKLEIIHGADHCFRGEKTNEWQNEAIELTVDWFKKWLK